MTRRGDMRPDTRGFALILVLWFLVLFAAIGAYLMAHGRLDTAMARNIVAAAHAEALADAGLARALFNLTVPEAESRWRLDGEAHDLAIAGGRVTVRLFDENQKINPNTAADFLIAALFEAAGVDRLRSRRMGAAIADWVDGDDDLRPLGAEARQYRDAGKTYEPPNAAFQSLDELQLVLGMTPDLLASVLPYLTLFGDGSGLQDRSAPPLIRRAVALAANAPGREGGDMAPSAGAAGGPPSAAERIVEIDATAASADGGVFVRHAIVRIGTANARGYSVLAWERRALSE